MWLSKYDIGKHCCSMVACGLKENMRLWIWTHSHIQEMKQLERRCNGKIQTCDSIK